MPRPRLYDSDAERQRAYRERRREEDEVRLRAHHQRQERLRAALVELVEAAEAAARDHPAGEWGRLYAQNPGLDAAGILLHLAREIRAGRQ